MDGLLLHGLMQHGTVIFLDPIKLVDTAKPPLGIPDKMAIYGE